MSGRDANSWRDLAGDVTLTGNKVYAPRLNVCLSIGTGVRGRTFQGSLICQDIHVQRERGSEGARQRGSEREEVVSKTAKGGECVKCQGSRSRALVSFGTCMTGDADPVGYPRCRPSRCQDASIAHELSSRYEPHGAKGNARLDIGNSTLLSSQAVSCRTD